MQTSLGWTVVGDTRDRLGESALWHPDQRRLYWVDFYEPAVRRIDPVTGELECWRLGHAGTIGSLAFVADDRLLVGLDAGVHLLDLRDGSLAPFADPNGGRAGIGYNDAKVDRGGCYWVGTFDVSETSARGILYRIDGMGRVSLGDSGYVVCNGPAFSPAGDTLYFSDTSGRRIIAYDLDRETGALSAARVFAAFSETDGFPDGLCVDSTGSLYCALYGTGRVRVFSADGEQRTDLLLPVRNVTSCCIGGANLDTLYVTTGESDRAHPLDGALFALTVETTGIPEPKYLLGTPGR
jgi:sugar lactone lactonase YvrE